ncbi:L-glyceraldehyde 3-phosphate reductase [Pedobacter duraquae]|uniref:L-glyceraldehyde 3-phosphate reductase n=1 Tax=Pedobacter duraquae TaxID=425511 RepID=A0A4R6IPX3_9SPHI|nr:L-glyceraldehyde 3-phosphate reductase [Pedobacter duraquae]TDO24360.1 L-glyceraldehyde 3-phosphate reductase [Pedobacter duraquae]
MNYTASANRYNAMTYRKCGNSGVNLPLISLGLWHNFGDVDISENYSKILHLAFDKGITHFDLANNYGPPYGTAEQNFGRLLARDFKSYRDELIISTKAGYDMWKGPYGDGGSKKYLVSSLDQSLKRMGLDYVDIFYHHRPDPETPLEETMRTLDLFVRQGKALYVGISNYQAEDAAKAFQILNDLGTPCLIHQPKYSMLERWPERGLLDLLEQEGVGCIPFSPLAQGILTSKYLGGIPDDSRAAKSSGHLQASSITEAQLQQVRALNKLAESRDQTLAQMALSWLMKDQRVTSVLVGASKPEQLADSLRSLDHLHFYQEELEKIDQILA